MNLCKTDLCTGCGACYNICPKEAIEFVPNEMGFKYPRISEEKCVECHQCERVCPILNMMSLAKPQKVFAAFSRNNSIRANSASGGIATELGKAIVQIGGVVFGVQQTDGIHAEFNCASTVEELSKFQNSKYVESILGTAYDDVRAMLKNGKTVLFVGLPCQVAGLLNYIPKSLQEKLFVIDLVCHGTPSAAFFEECLKEEYGEDARVIAFRNTEAQFFLKVQKKWFTADYPPPTDLYYNSFTECYSYRESCYHCSFAQINRVSDLTIGDFWGLGDETPYPYDTQKVSLVMQNTEKGKQLLELICNDVQIDERNLEEATRQNAQLCHPSVKNELAKQFQISCQHMNSYQAALKISGRFVRYQKARYKLSRLKRKLISFVKSVT